MGEFRQDEQYEYDEYGKFGGNGKKKHYSDPRKNSQDKNRLEKLTKALATAAAAAIIVTGGIAAADPDFSDQVKKDTAKKPVSQNTVSPKDLVHSQHSWDEGTVKLAATCTEDGIILFSCTGCDETREEKIPAAGHLPVSTDDSTEATCTEGGHTGQTVCQNCGLILEEAKETEPLGHDWGEEVVTKEPTCTAEGVKTITCARCGETQTTAIPAAGHVDKDLDYKCDICGKPTITLSITKIEYSDQMYNITIRTSAKVLNPDAWPQSDNMSIEGWFDEDGRTIHIQLFPDPPADSSTRKMSFTLYVFGTGVQGEEPDIILTKTYKFNFGLDEFYGRKKLVIK